MGRFVDSLIAYRILKLLVTPFDQTDAYKLGIIDAKGKELKRMQELNSVNERDAYTLLHRLVFRLKKIIEKVPIDNKKLLSLAAAYALIKENLDQNNEPIDLETQYINKLNEELQSELMIVEEFLYEKKLFTFKQFNEEGEGMAAAAPANNAAVTSGIKGLTGEPPVSKKAQKRWTNKNSIIRRK
jgi:hypothetical protein